MVIECSTTLSVTKIFFKTFMLKALDHKAIMFMFYVLRKEIFISNTHKLASYLVENPPYSSGITNSLRLFCRGFYEQRSKFMCFSEQYRTVFLAGVTPVLLFIPTYPTLTRGQTNTHYIHCFLFKFCCISDSCTQDLPLMV